MSRILNPGVPLTALPPMVMVGLYLDESEDRHTGVFTLAAWMAVPMIWDLIVGPWNDMVSDAPHPIDAFHLKDLAHKSGDFSDENGWTQPERDALVIRATDIITDYKIAERDTLTAFGCSVMRKDMKWEEESTYDIYQTCYVTLFRDVLSRFSAYKAFDFVFDCKEKVRRNVEAHFWQAKTDIDSDPQLRGMLQGCSFRSDTGFAPLQAADFIAYERRKRNSDRAIGSTRHRRSFQRLCQARPHYFKVLDHRFITRVSAEAEVLGHPPTDVYRFIADDDD